jgi:hypothetical protein
MHRYLVGELTGKESAAMSIFPAKILLATDGSKEAELARTTAVDIATTIGVIFTAGSSPSSRRLGRWFMLRLTVTGYGAAHVLPGGGPRPQL